MTFDTPYILVGSGCLLVTAWWFALAWQDKDIMLSDKIVSTLSAAGCAIAGLYGLGRGLMLW